MKSNIPEMGGEYKSRKFILTLISVIILTGFAVSGIWFKEVLPILPSFVSGLLGILTLYFAGNVGNKFVVGKQLALKQEPDYTEVNDQE